MRRQRYKKIRDLGLEIRDFFLILYFFRDIVCLFNEKFVTLRRTLLINYG